MLATCVCVLSSAERQRRDLQTTPKPSKSVSSSRRAPIAKAAKPEHQQQNPAWTQSANRRPSTSPPAPTALDAGLWPESQPTAKAATGKEPTERLTRQKPLRPPRPHVFSHDPAPPFQSYARSLDRLFAQPPWCLLTPARAQFGRNPRRRRPRRLTTL
ncbi:hypothetical protein GGTG_12765 [Gaeumannomyces tritici R3-111a-1]|uniref:Uncharacterized protein n=1 Tax=Gaeumannomyces tritici (strain R3-111a-1) TaxID=644352 RepID=J3PGY5_GAET3|nr:hypothetical protein GGTG_12765 [Gaeumannomyces tritici R3-111a-1]EJT69882.1 hypothetical protein GGTG_12765 [Gaeumannomyces tritici R3-111a-1]